MASRRDRQRKLQRAADRRRRKEEKRRAAKKTGASGAQRPAKANAPAIVNRAAPSAASAPNPGFAVRRIGYGALTGKQATWERAIELLRKLSLRQVLDLAGRISAVLQNSDSADQATQLYLSQVFFRSQAPGLWAKAKLSAGRPGAPIALFDEAMLLAALKLACVHLPTDGPDNEDPFAVFGEALLILNDVVEKDSLSGPVALAERERLGYFRTVARLFYERSNYMQALTRAFDLFLTDRPHLRSEASAQPGAAYVDLPALLENATGLAAHEYFAVCFAFLSHFYTIDRESAPTTHAIISYEHYFRATTISPKRAAHLFDLVMQPAVELQDEVRRSEPAGRVDQFTHLPLAAKPLVRIDDQVFAPLLQLVMAKLTSGLYHTLLNSYDLADRKNRQTFQQYMGRVFEDYVDATFRRALRGSSARWISERELLDAMPATKKARPPMCDGVLVQGDAIILVEAKAKLLAAAVRSGTDEAGFWAKMDELLVKPARQLSSVIDALQAGQLQQLGLTLGPRTVIYPLVVHLQDLPSEPIVYEWAEARWTADGFLQQAGVQPLQAWHIGDIEALEPVMQRGLDLATVLREKVSNKAVVGETLINGLILLGRSDWMHGRNAHLDARYREIMDASEKYLVPVEARN